jgi:alkaline phosphatase
MNMIRFSIAVIVFSILNIAKAQTYNSSRIFAHNDYAQAIPFYTAYNLNVGFMEADVFLHDGEIFVAHHAREIRKGKTLEALYLAPLVKAVRKNHGSVHEPPQQSLTLMIDLKTEGVSTLAAIVNKLQKYPELLGIPSLHFMISGNVPDPARWTDFPSYLDFDGRPGIPYTPAQLKRVGMISTNFRDHVKWNGKGRITAEEAEKIRSMMEDVHAKGKKMRFWATPDFETAWKELIRMKMDVIVSDDVTALAAFLNNQNKP